MNTGAQQLNVHIWYTILLLLLQKAELSQRLATGKWPWRSLKVIGIAAIRLAIHHFLLKISLSCTVPIYYHMYSTCWLPLILRSPPVLITHLKLQATCIF